jgi:hypothetical protein
VLLAERFGGGLEEYANMPAQRRQYWLGILSQEAYVHNLYAEASEGMSPGDPIFIAEIEYGLEEDDDAST